MREYLRLLPFGYSVAASFISILHDPMEIEMSADILETEQAFREMLDRGGEPVDRELAALVNDMYQLEMRFREEDKKDTGSN